MRPEDGQSPVSALAAAAAALMLAWCIYSWPWLSGSVTIPWDAKNHFYPMLRFMAASLAEGQSPNWSPYHYAGHPMVADPQSLVFSPPYRLLAEIVPVPTFQHQDAVELLMLLLGGLGLLLFFREKGWGVPGGTLAALVFVFGGPASARLQHVGQILSYAAIPIALWAAERLLRRVTVASGLLLGAAGALLAVGRDQVALLGCYLVGGYVLVGLFARPGGTTRLRSLALPIAAGGAAAAALLAVPVGLTIAFAAISNRPEISFHNAALGSLHPGALLSTVIPDVFSSRGPWDEYWGPGSAGWRTDWLWLDRALVELYSGTLPLVVLVAAGLLGGKALARGARFFLASAIVFLLYAFGWFTPFFGLAYEWVPGIDLFRRPADATFLTTLLIAILAGHAFHRCLADPRPSLGPFALVGSLAFFGGLYILAGWLGRSSGKLEGQLLSTLGGGLVLVVLAHFALFLVVVSGRRPAVIAALSLAAADLVYFNTASGLNSEPPSVYAELDPRVSNPVVQFLKLRLASEKEPARRDRVEILGLSGPWQNAPQAWGLEATLGYNPLRWGAYQRATGAGDNSHVPMRSFTPLFPGYDTPLAKLLGLGYLAAPIPAERIDRTLRPGDFRRVATIGRVQIFEVPGTLPRAFFVESWALSDFEHMMETGEWPAVDLRRAVLLDSPPPRPQASGTGSEPADSLARTAIASYRNTEVRITVETARPGFLVLNDIWNPWWRAEVDGRPAPVLRANVLFRAVPLAEGRHDVTLYFAPVSGLLDEIRRTVRRSAAILKS